MKNEFKNATNQTPAIYNSTYNVADYDGLVKNVKIIQFTQVTIVTLANLSVVFLFYAMKRRRRTIPNFLLLMQAVTDLYIAGMMWYELIIEETLKDSPYFRTNAVFIFTGLLYYSLTLSLGTLFLGSLERYLAIVKPYFHKCYIRLDRIIYLTVGVWTLSAIPPTLKLTLMKHSEKRGNAWSVIIYDIIFDVVMLGVIFVVVGMLVLTLSSASASCQEQEKLRRRCSSRRLSKTSTVGYKKRLRLSIIFLLMISAYAVSFLPIAVGGLLTDTSILEGLSLYDSIVLISVSHVLYKASALFNPFFTILIKEDYRMALVKLFYKRKVIFQSSST